MRTGDVPRAVSQYKLAVEIDGAAADVELAARLGIGPEYDGRDVVDGKLRAHAQTEPAARETEVERPTVTFQDVGGMDQLKEEIRLKILYPLTHPEIYEAYGKQVGGGILMYLKLG